MGHPLNLVFVHGAWADGSGWGAVIERLLGVGRADGAATGQRAAVRRGRVDTVPRRPVQRRRFAGGTAGNNCRCGEWFVALR
jgi:hypothetical protein